MVSAVVAFEEVCSDFFLVVCSLLKDKLTVRRKMCTRTYLAHRVQVTKVSWVVVPLASATVVCTITIYNVIGPLYFSVVYVNDFLNDWERDLLAPVDVHNEVDVVVVPWSLDHNRPYLDYWNTVLM